MCRRSELQAGIREQDGSATTQNDRCQSDPAEAFERETLIQKVWQQQQTGDAETERGDVPRREACPQSKPRHDNPSGPDADGRKAIESTTNVICGSTVADSQTGHHPLSEMQWNM